MTRLLSARLIAWNRLATGMLLGLLMIVYAAGEIWLALRHEPWRDESQAWLIARDASLGELFGRVLSEEGHPALWYLMLMPFAKAGMPYASMLIVSMVVTFAAVTVFFVADVPLWVKIVLPFTPLCVYYLPVLSRSYCLVALVCALIIAVYPQRLRRPWCFAVLLALPFQVHVWLFGFAGMLFLIFARDLRRAHRSLWPLLVPVASMALTVFELLPRGGGDSSVQLHVPDSAWTTFGMAFAVMMLAAWSVGWRCGLMASASYGWVLIVLNMMYPHYSAQKMASFLWIMLAVALMGERDCIERMPRHAVITGHALWRAPLTGTLTVLCIAMLVPQLSSPWYWSAITADARTTVSLGHSMAERIKRLDKGNEPLTLVPTPDSDSVYAASNALPYLSTDVRLWNSMTHRNMTYADDAFRVALHEQPRSEENIVERTLEEVRRSGSDRVVIVGCGAFAETNVPDQFEADARFVSLGGIASPDATLDLTRGGVTGFRCELFSYEPHLPVSGETSDPISR